MTIEVFLIITAILGILFCAEIVADRYLCVGVFYFLYLLFTKELFHFIDKRNLVSGDLIFIKFRGKFRKAYIKDVSLFSNTAQLIFDEAELNIKLMEFNHYPLSRLIIPDYMGKVAKLLYSEMGDKKK